MDVVGDVEIEVAEILRTMAEIHERRRPRPIPGQSYWGTKSRRSARPLPSSSAAAAAAGPEITGDGAGSTHEVERQEKLWPRRPLCLSSSKQCKEKGVTRKESIRGHNRTKKFLQQEKCTVEASGPRPETQPVVLVDPPPLSLTETIGDRRSVPPPAALAQPATTTSRNIGGTAGRSGIPDLNAIVDESGSVPADWTQSGHHEQVAVTVDLKKIATAEARKKRLAICRRRRPAGGGGARIGVNSVGIATKA